MTSIDQLHKESCEQNEEYYIDPKTGYKVFSSVYLEKEVNVAAVLADIVLTNIKMLNKG